MLATPALSRVTDTGGSLKVGSSKTTHSYKNKKKNVAVVSLMNTLKGTAHLPRTKQWLCRVKRNQTPDFFHPDSLDAKT